MTEYNNIILNGRWWKITLLKYKNFNKYSDNKETMQCIGMQEVALI